MESLLHINLLELRAIRLVLKAFLPSIHQRLVQVLTDTTAMWHCNKLRRMGSWLLCQEALRLWNWLVLQSIFLVAQHLVGSLNVRGDERSRRCLMDHELRVRPERVQGLFHEWGEPWLDLFTTTETVQCQHFCVLEFSKRLSQGDAFHLEWNSGILYAFLPKALLPRVLEDPN